MRLFVAVNLPAGERHAAWDAAGPLREAGLPVRWVVADGFHVTLKFLGEVDPAQREPIGAALTGAVRRLKPFDVTLGGIGAFPSFDRPRVVWLGVEHHPALELLANDVEHALRPFGFESELRPFQPHVTIGRTQRDAASSATQPLETLAGRVAYAGLMTLTSVDLMESVPGHAGSEYRLLHSAPLAGGR